MTRRSFRRWSSSRTPCRKMLSSVAADRLVGAGWSRRSRWTGRAGSRSGRHGHSGVRALRAGTGRAHSTAVGGASLTKPAIRIAVGSADASQSLPQPDSSISKASPNARLRSVSLKSPAGLVLRPSLIARRASSIREHSGIQGLCCLNIQTLPHVVEDRRIVGLAGLASWFKYWRAASRRGRDRL
jgi:hypothetical protein